MIQADMEGELAFFIDESGSRKPNPQDPARYFALGGVLLNRNDESLVEARVKDFKQRWNIPDETPLHGNEIRSRKKKFSWLGKEPEHEQERFLQELTEMVIGCPIVVHACVVLRSGYHMRYLQQYGENTWEMTRSAFSILIERAAKYAAERDSTIMIYYEEAGEVEDKLMKQYFQQLRSSGHPFNPETAGKYSPMPAADLSSLLRGIEGKKKSNAILQVADLCLYPVVKSKEQPNNRAFVALHDRQLLVDCHLKPDQVESLGIKYYCFDSNLKN
jgi:hypothetical protein